MATPIRPATTGGAPAPRRPDSTFTRNLRFEWASEEGRALVGSYAISIGLGLAFLAMVHLVDPPPEVQAAEAAPTQVTFVPDTLQEEAPPVVEQAGAVERVAEAGPRNQPPGPRGRESGSPRAGRPGSRTETNAAGAIGTAFGTGSGAGTGGMVGDVSGILRGVDVSSGSGGTGGGQGGSGGGGAGGKAVIGYGQGGQGARTPGRGGIGGGLGTGGGGGGGVGGVGGGGGMRAAPVRVGAPRVIAAPMDAGPGRDVSELGTFVRSRESQLRFCYVEHGLKVNPSLAGTINVAITMTGSGSVTDVDVTSRTWGGNGSSAAEQCIVQRIRSWKFPPSPAGGGTYSFPFNFTR